MKPTSSYLKGLPIPSFNRQPPFSYTWSTSTIMTSSFTCSPHWIGVCFTWPPHLPRSLGPTTWKRKDRRTVSDTVNLSTNCEPFSCSVTNRATRQGSRRIPLEYRTVSRHDVWSLNENEPTVRPTFYVCQRPISLPEITKCVATGTETCTLSLHPDYPKVLQTLYLFDTMYLHLM